MIRFILLMFLIGSTAFAHEHHDDALKPNIVQSGSSILQLESKWTSQKGKVVSLSDLNGKSRLLVMLFTRCETACPLIVEDLKEVAKDLESASEAHKFEVSIFSLDSFRETPESLSSFATKRKLAADWQLYTSNSNAVAELAAALGVRYKRLKNGDFLHSNVIYFLNSKGEVVAQKDGIKTPRGEFIKRIKNSLSVSNSKGVTNGINEP